MSHCNRSVGFMLLGVIMALTHACAGCNKGNTGSSSGSGPQSGAGDAGGAASSSSSGGASSGGVPNGLDGGRPLEEPLLQFCAGQGPVVGITSGSAGARCAGQLAQDTFQFALCACEQLVIGAQLTVDAFDSRAGPYGGANILPDGQVGMNGGPLTLSKKLTVMGSLYVGGGGLQLGPDSLVNGNLLVNGDLVSGSNTRGTVGRNAFVHGNVSSDYTIAGSLQVPTGASVDGTVTGSVLHQDFTLAPPCACGAGQVLDIGAITAWAATHNDNHAVDAGVREDLWAVGTGPGSLTLPCGRYYFTSIVQGGAITLRAAGRVAVFVDGDATTAGFAIELDPGAELDLFVKGNLAVSGPSSFGSAASPVSVRTYVGGNLTVQASAVFAGNVYAPHASLHLSASSTVYGSVFAREVVVDANAQVHFDSAIREAGGTCTASPDGGILGDAGAQAPDAGPTLCQSVCDPVCGARACGPGGVCGACVSDLDCCAPAACAAGLCEYNG